MSVELGRAYPLHAGSTGKAILSVVPVDLRNLVLNRPLDSLTDTTVIDRTALEAELTEIAEAGVAVSRGERQVGAGSVAAPVYAMGGLVVGAISVCGPIDRFDAQAVAIYKPLVRDAAAAVSAGLATPDIPPAAA